MNRLIDHIRQYVQLTPAEESVLQTKIKNRTYLKGQYIVQSGDVCRFHTFIVSGKIRTFYLDNNGNEHVVSFGIENWWVGDMGSLISQSPADFDVQCLENSQVIQISYDNLQQLFEELPKMERFFRIIIQNAYVTAQKRIVRNYSLSARDRYLLFRDEYPDLIQRIPQYMIASYLGITKEFLSHIKNQIAKESRG